MVRISLGAYNTRDEVDAAVEVISHVANGRLTGRYRRTSEEEYAPF